LDCSETGECHKELGTGIATMEHHGELMTESATVRNNMGKAWPGQAVISINKIFDNESKTNRMELACSTHKEITNTGSPKHGYAVNIQIH
jgi:hypothetical protein